MKIFSNVLTSASSGAWNWSSALDMRHAKNGYFNLEYYVSASQVTFAYSGCSVSDGIFTRSGSTIVSSFTSASGTNLDGRGFSPVTPDIFPFIKIGAYAVGGTPAISCSLIVD